MKTIIANEDGLKNSRNGGFGKFLDCVRGARTVLEKCQSTEPSMVPLHWLEEEMRKCRNVLLAQLKNRYDGAKTKPSEERSDEDVALVPRIKCILN